MTLDPLARSCTLLARILRAPDHEAAIHPLLTTCLHGPSAFAVLLPHLPADYVGARVRIRRALRERSRDLESAAEALDRAALALTHGARPGGCAADCACRAVQAEGVDAYLTRSVATVASVLLAAPEPYYQQLGVLLSRLIDEVQARRGPSSNRRPEAGGIELRL